MATRYHTLFAQPSPLNKPNNFDKLNRLSDKLNVINVYNLYLQNRIP